MRGGAGNVNAELYIRNVFLSPNPVDAGTLFLISVDVLVLFPEETVHRLPFGLGGPRRVSNIPDYTIVPKLPFKLGDQRGIRE